MNFVANAAISAAVINAALAAFVFYTNPRSTLNRVYALWGGCVSLWNFAAFFKSFPYVTEVQARVWVGIIQGAVIFLPLALAHLCQLIVHNRTPKWIYPFYALHFGLILSLIFTPHYMQGVQRVSVLGWWSVAGPLFKVYLASYAILTIPLVFGLPVYAWKVKSDRRSQILVLWFSILTLWVTGTNDMMPILGRTYYPGTNLSFIPLGNFWIFTMPLARPLHCCCVSALSSQSVSFRCSSALRSSPAASIGMRSSWRWQRSQLARSSRHSCSPNS